MESQKGIDGQIKQIIEMGGTKDRMRWDSARLEREEAICEQLWLDFCDRLGFSS